MSSTSLLDLGEEHPVQTKINRIGKILAIFAGVLIGFNSRSSSEVLWEFGILICESLILWGVALIKRGEDKYAIFMAFSVYICAMAASIPVTFWVHSYAMSV